MMPAWWTKWCSFEAFMLVWSIGWGVWSFPSWGSGFQIGLAFVWVLLIANQQERYWRQQSNKVQAEIMELQDRTICTLHDHIRMLKARRNDQR